MEANKLSTEKIQVQVLNPTYFTNSFVEKISPSDPSKNINNLQVFVLNNKINIKWTDCSDPNWKSNIVVKAENYIPLCPYEEKIVDTTYTKNAYALNSLIDNDIQPNKLYCYRIFTEFKNSDEFYSGLRNIIFIYVGLDGIGDDTPIITPNTYTKVTINSQGKVISGSVLIADDIPNITLNKISDAGTAASKNVGILAGNVPIVNDNGKLDSSIIPMAEYTLPIATSTLVGGIKQGKNIQIDNDGTINSNPGTGNLSVAEGNQTIADNAYAHAEGNTTQAHGQASHAEGYMTIAKDSNSHAEGSNTQANGYISHAENSYTIANGMFSHSEGDQSKANGIASHSEGQNTTANGDFSHSQGAYTIASGIASHSEGEATQAIGIATHAEGQNTIVNGDNSHGEGYSTFISGNNSHTEGNISSVLYGTLYHIIAFDNTNKTLTLDNVTNLNTNIVAYIYQTDAKVIAIKIKAINGNVITIESVNGDPITADNYKYLIYNSSNKIDGNTHVEGYNNLVVGQNSHAEGYQTIVNSDNSHGEGYQTLTSNIKLYLITNYNVNNKTLVLSDPSNPYFTDMSILKVGMKILIGTQYVDTIKFTISAVNNNNSTITVKEPLSFENGNHCEFIIIFIPDKNSYAHAEGYQTMAGGDASHAEGYGNIVAAYGAHAEGQTNIVTGICSHAEGANNQAFGSNCHVEGTDNIAREFGSHAEGQNTEAVKPGSHAEGGNTRANGYNAHAEGCVTLANADYAHAEGDYTTASAYGAHSEGRGTFAETEGSHSEGKITTATLGTIYNIIDFDDVNKTITLDNVTNAINLNTNTKVLVYINDKSSIYTTITAITDNTITISDKPENTWRYIIYNSSDFSYINASHAEGYNTLAAGQASHTQGYKTIAIGGTSHAEGYKTIAAGKTSHAEGNQTQANGICSHSEGDSTVAMGDNAHVEGNITQAIGISSHAEGYYTQANGNGSHSEGSSTQATGDYSHAEGAGAISSGMASHSEGYGTTSGNYASHTSGKYNKPLQSTGSGNNQLGDAFVIGNGYFDSSSYINVLSNAFRVTYNGQVYGTQAYNASGADYAEYFEWLDGNPNNEDRVGCFVTLDGDKIKLASTEDYILGVISSNPSVIGNADEDWLGKYLHDDFGGFIYEDIKEIKEQIDPNTGKTTYVETGNIIKNGRLKLNPNYDSKQTYIPRSERNEWALVGMLGVLAVKDDGTCQVNKFCKPNENGIATTCDITSNIKYRVIKRINDNIIMIVLR
jgi:hypothetical protein